MDNKNEKIICELHESLMKESLKQIGELISNIQGPGIENKGDVIKHDSGSILTIETIEEALPPPEDHSGLDKINEIRREVAVNQSAEILTPDKQSELMEIVRQRSEEFERELRRIAFIDNDTIESSAQKFQDELMDNVSKQFN